MSILYFTPDDDKTAPTTVVPVVSENTELVESYRERGWREVRLYGHAVKVERKENGGFYVDGVRWFLKQDADGYRRSAFHHLEQWARHDAVADFLEEEESMKDAEYTEKVNRMTAIVESAPELTERSIAVHLLEHGVTLP